MSRLTKAEIAEVPSIYVASLSDYNAGRLHGCWIELGEDTTLEDVEREIAQMLRCSPESGAEEWEVHDVDNWPMGLSDQAARWGLETAVEAGNAIAKHGEAIAAHYEHSGVWDVNYFKEHYMGTWPSERAFIEDEFTEIMGVEIDPILEPHIDWDSLTKDIMNSRFDSSTGTTGTHIFFQG